MDTNVQEITWAEYVRMHTAKKDNWDCEKEGSGGWIMSHNDELINFVP
jgi:hypothetical protein